MARALLTQVLVVTLRRQPSPSASCTDARDVCEQIFEWTGLGWLAEGSYYLLIKPLRILLIVLLAVVVRHLVHRMILQLTRPAPGAGPGVVTQRPLRTRALGARILANGGASERRRARTAALGSILRSIASAVVSALAAMLVLDELGVNLAPILAGAGIVGIAVGFGAQNLVRDFLSGLFMLLEDQYGVGDLVDVDDVVGTVEAVGLRITTVRDGNGVIWYIRNGEIARLGNKSQGWALVTVDVPVGFTGVDRATEALRQAAARLAADKEWSNQLVEAPEVLGVEEITPDGAVLRTAVKTPSGAQCRVARELRRRLTEAIHTAGISGPTSDRLTSGGDENPAVPAQIGAQGRGHGGQASAM